MFTSPEEIIDQLVQVIETNTIFRLPVENRKNVYTKACWILSIHQKLYLAAGENVPELLERINTLKSRLPLLREYATLKESQKK